MDLTKNRIGLRVRGDFACFTRPEMKVERVSYDVMTPSAARGILESIYWKPEIRWVIDRIHVLAPIRFTNIRRNEVSGIGPSTKILKNYWDGKKGKILAQIVEDQRQQRASTILRDVDYGIEAHFIVLASTEQPQKHYEIFKRRAEKGQYFQHPYLGCREFDASFEWVDPVAVSTLMHPADIDQELGWMLLDIDFKNNMNPLFFKAKIKNGIVNVPSITDNGVKL